MLTFHFQIITLKNSHFEFLPCMYVTVLTSFQENDPYMRRALNVYLLATDFAHPDVTLGV